MVSKEFIRQLEGYGLTTANILYRLPDHPHLLQTFIWQEYDLAPKFPVMFRFLEFWKQKLEGPLHSVAYSHRRLIANRPQCGNHMSVSGELECCSELDGLVGQLGASPRGAAGG